MTGHYLNPGLPAPAPARDGLDAPYWEGLRQEILRLQFCSACEHWQWGPEWLCHHCHGFALEYRPVTPAGRIYSYERVWHPVHDALREQGPYLVVLVELPEAGNVRLIGNLLGDPLQEVRIGAAVSGHFEHHEEADPPFTLLHWQCGPAG